MHLSPSKPIIRLILTQSCQINSYALPAFSQLNPIRTFTQYLHSMVHAWFRVSRFSAHASYLPGSIRTSCYSIKSFPLLLGLAHYILKPNTYLGRAKERWMKSLASESLLRAFCKLHLSAHARGRTYVRTYYTGSSKFTLFETGRGYVLTYDLYTWKFFKAEWSAGYFEA